MGGSVWTRKSKEGANRKEEIVIASIVEFTTIVTLDKSYRKAEVHKSILMKIKKNCVSIRLGAKRKRPYIMRVIINNN